MMTIKTKRILAVLCALCLDAGFAQPWRNIEAGDWVCGPHIKSPASLAGKVVLVDVWGVHCPPCRELLPRLEQLWESFRDKPFVLIGSHRQERDEELIKKLVEAKGVKYPVYQNAGLAEDDPADKQRSLPYMYVVNHRGKVVYKGRSDREATEALVNALTEVGLTPNLVAGVSLVKYKNLEKQLVFGKPIATILPRLESAAKSKNATAADEARQILAAIDKARQNTQDEIDYLKELDPVAAVKLIMQFKVTWPDAFDASYKSGMSALVAKAKAFKAEQAKRESKGK